MYPSTCPRSSSIYLQSSRLTDSLLQETCVTIAIESDETTQAGLITHSNKKPPGEFTGGFLLEWVRLWYNRGDFSPIPWKGRGMKTITIAVIIPTYNESDNIEALAKEILALRLSTSTTLRPCSGRASGGTSGQALSDTTKIIIVDDNSPDGTGKIADELAKLYSGIKVIHRPAKLGLGTAYIAGFKEALALGADCVVTMDADFSHHPSYIPDLVASSRDAQLVIGSRYVGGGGTVNWGLRRQILSRGANAFARLALGIKAHDCTAGFRCYRRVVLESIELNEIFSDGYSFLIEMLYKCQRRGWEIGEVPIIFEDRRHGASKISQREIFKALYTVLCLGCKRVFRRG